MKLLAWILSLCALWLAFVAARLTGLVAWPWVWVLSPMWLPSVAFVVCAVVALAVSWALSAWAWLREVRAARRRLRSWRAFNARSLSTLTTPAEVFRRHGVDPDPHVCKPPFRRGR